MNDSTWSSNSSLILTSTVSIRATTSRIPQREQVLIDAFNTYIQIGIGSLLFLFGLTFNCLSLLYFRASRSFRHTTFQLYFSIICLLDTVRLFEFFIFVLFDKGYLHVTLHLCRWVFFTIMFTGQASIWLTVALAVEKCIIIWFPIKGRLCFTISISKIVLVLVLCLVFLANVIYLLPNFFLHAYANVSIHTFMCIWQTVATPKSRYDNWKKHYFTFNTIFFHSIIPSILLLVINWLILYSLSRQRVVLSKIGSIDARHVLKREKQFKEKTIQLVLSSFFVIFTISPRYILTMVNAFASNISQTPLMPLYIYVNLNTVFRVLEMSNYSLNLMFAIMSGRTSRREIRRLLWECFFWRFRRTRSSRQNSKIQTHAFLFDDEDDTEHSVATTAISPYCGLASQSQNRSTYLSRQNSCANYPTQSLRKPTTFTCCGFTINLSSRHSLYSSNGDLTSRRSTICKSTTNTITNNHAYNSPRKSRTCPYSPRTSSSVERQLRRQHTVCYTSNGDDSRSTLRPRSATIVHCFRHRPSTTLTAVVKPSPAEPASSRTSNSLLLTTDVHNANTTPALDSTASPGFLPNRIEEEQSSPAYIVERC